VQAHEWMNDKAEGSEASNLGARCRETGKPSLLMLHTITNITLVPDSAH